MGQGKGSNRAFNNYKKANIDHFSHQVNVTGVGPHHNKKKYSRKFNPKTNQEAIEEERRQDHSLQQQADNFPNDEEDDE
jgi:hypothetical protein